MSILLYGAETWLVAQAEIRRLRMFQMRCLWDNPWAHTMGQAKKYRHLEAGRENAHGEAAEAKTTAIARPCAADA